MTWLAAAAALVLVGAAQLWVAWRVSQRRPDRAALAGPLGLTGAVVATGGVGVLAAGGGTISEVFAAVGAAAAAVGTVVAVVAEIRVSRGRGSGRR